MFGPRGVAGAKSVGQTSSPAPLSTRILALRPLDALTTNNRPCQIGSDPPSQPLETWRREVLPPCSFVCFLHWALLVSPLATVPHFASEMRVFCLDTSSRLTLILLVFVFSFAFLALAAPTLSPDTFHLPCREPRAAQDRHGFSVPASILARTRAGFGKSHGKNDFQEITVGCWRVLHHSRYLDRLLEVCNCGKYVLCNVFLPGSKHVTKAASLDVHLLPSGTWVEDTSSAAVRFPPSPSYSFLEHSPRFQPKAPGNQGNQRQCFAFALRVDQGMNCFAYPDTVRVQTTI